MLAFDEGGRHTTSLQPLLGKPRPVSAVYLVLSLRGDDYWRKGTLDLSYCYTNPNPNQIIIG